MTPAFLASRQHPGVDGAAAALLHACTVVGICLGCLAPPMNARGPARGCRREEMTVSISPDLPCGETDPHARGYGCARETLCAARRGEGARARETLCAYRGRLSRDVMAFDELWATRIVWSTSLAVESECLGRSLSELTAAFCRRPLSSLSSTSTHASVLWVLGRRKKSYV